MKKFWKKTEGFTLVELVVVIAILGILAGVGTVGYSGYVKKANMAADQTLVRDVVYALELGLVSAPLDFTQSDAIVLSADSEPVYALGEDASPVRVAILSAFGDDAGLKLKYGNWSGAGIQTAVVSNFNQYVAGTDDRTKALGALFASGDDQAVPSFANRVEELYDLIQVTASNVANKADTTGSQLLKNAAAMTVDPSKTTLTTADVFANAWMGKAPGGGVALEWDTAYFGATGALNPDNVDDPAVDLAPMIASAAVVKARNVSLASYARKNNLLDEATCQMIENSSWTATGEGKMVPLDVMSTLTNSNNMDKFCSVNGVTDKEKFGSDLETLLNAYLGDGTANAPAYQDGLAYYAMMDTVNSVQGNEEEDAYWANMRDSVLMYGQIANKEITLEQMKEFYQNNTVIQGVGENDVLIVVDALTKKVSVSPASILK